MQHKWSDAKPVHGQVSVNAPAEKIFAILANPENIPAYIPGISSVTPVDDAFKATYPLQVAGLTLPLSFPVTFRLTDVQEPTKLAFDFTGMLQGTFSWTLQPQENDTTLVIGEASYQMSSTIIGSLLNFLANIHDAHASAFNRMLTGLKTISESSSWKSKSV